MTQNLFSRKVAADVSITTSETSPLHSAPVQANAFWTQIVNVGGDALEQIGVPGARVTEILCQAPLSNSTPVSILNGILLYPGDSVTLNLQGPELIGPLSGPPGGALVVVSFYFDANLL